MIGSKDFKSDEEVKTAVATVTTKRILYKVSMHLRNGGILAFTVMETGSKNDIEYFFLDCYNIKFIALFLKHPRMLKCSDIQSNDV